MKHRIRILYLSLCLMLSLVFMYLVIKLLKIKKSLETSQKWTVQDYIRRVLNIGNTDSHANSLVYGSDSKYLVTRYLASLYVIIQEDILFVSDLVYSHMQHVSISDIAEWEFNAYFIYIISGFFIIFIIFKILQTYGGKKKKSTNSACRDISQHSDHNQNQVLRKGFGILVFVALLISIPWEFVRLYQIEVAKRASAIQVGIPPECVPDKMSLLQSVNSWFHWLLSWRHDPCEQYHKMLLVDPLWEIPPLLVISSAFTRCILHPVEIVFVAIGRCLRLFFTEIPVTWQPFMMVILTLVIIIILLLTFGYRLTLPLLLRIEPRTPIFLQSRHSKRTEKQTNEGQSCRHRGKEKKRLSYSFEDR